MDLIAYSLVDYESNYGDENKVDSLINPLDYPVKNVLDILLQDKTTKKNIIWATDAYAANGDICADKSEIIPEAFSTGLPVTLRTRSEKEFDARQERTRVRAEVFTPGWICNKMINCCDEVWFGRTGVFNKEGPDRTWTVNNETIEFPKGKNWQKYVDSRRLEITCGEAPFLVSRYDASSGELIFPLINRVGILDRKLRVVNENAQSKNEWEKWALRAFQSCYGYEWQGDNLLIARINLFLTFCDYYKNRWVEDPNPKLLRSIANTIAWNLWQMDGITDTVPMGKPLQPTYQMTLFDDYETKESVKGDFSPSCKIYDWRRDNSTPFFKIKERGKMNKRKLFDFVIGNPPYQAINDRNGRQPPIYNIFMDAAYEVSSKVMLITPGRFLSGVGQTPKEWNEKMLNDPHFKVMFYDSVSKNVFPGTDIKGGVAIHYRDEDRTFGPIEVFSPFPELREICLRVKKMNANKPMFSSIIASQGISRFTDLAISEHLEITDINGAGTKYKIVSASVEQLPDVFKNVAVRDDDLRILYKGKSSRGVRFIERRYIQPNEYVDTFNVCIPESNGAGSFEKFSSPVILKPGCITSDTFLSIGVFESEKEANAALSYIKTKFVRALLGIKKVTQHNPKDVWIYVPMEDFTSDSDIDWTKSVSEIDSQLYKKYKLTEREIEFITSAVEEMT